MYRGDSSDNPLTARELEVLALIGEGLSNKEIAAELFVALSTIKWHARQIYNKLGVDGRKEAVDRARAMGLLVDGTAMEVALRHNLPAQLSSFIGREREVADIQRLLSSARLVTLTGPGGSGKTRVALRAAAVMAEEFDAGVTFVSLAATRDPEAVPQTIAVEFGVKELPDRPLVEVLKRFLSRKQMLLVLDNYEHLLSAAPLVSELLNAAPQLTVLATSREALKLSGEHEYMVPPLPLPDPDPAAAMVDLMSVASVRLFVERARAVQNDFRLTEENGAAVAAICRRLDGLPLAIELAAARSKLFKPQQLLIHLDDRFQLLTGGARDLANRQQTLRATIDWSYNLLNEEEQTLFDRLAVFYDGRTVEAVQAVCCSGLDLKALMGLDSLLNKNLVYQRSGPGSAPRFYMLETIHAYADERLCEQDELEGARDRHLDYFAHWSEAIAPRYHGPEQLALFEQTEAEMNNIRIALRWAVQSGQIEKGVRLVTAVTRYLRHTPATLVDGYRLTLRFLPQLGQAALRYRVPFLLGLSDLALINNERDRFQTYARQAMALANELGDRRLQAWSLVMSADYSDDPLEFEEAVGSVKEAIAVLRELKDTTGIAWALNVLGEIYRVGGELALARAAYEESLVLFTETGNLTYEQGLKSNLSLLAYNEGDYERARSFYTAVLQRRERHWTTFSVAGLSGPLAQLGQPEKAARLLGATARFLSEFGIEYFPDDAPVLKQYESDTRAMLDEATFARAWAEGQQMTHEEALDYALEGSTNS